MSRSPDIVLVDTGCANLASVSAAVARLGGRALVTAEERAVREAHLVVLPGVGAFGAALDRLRRGGLDRAIRERVSEDRPLLAICLGMQVLCEASDESPGVPGLGLVPGALRRFATARVPQMGWNRIAPSAGSSLLRPGAFYFANSYRLGALPAGWIGATADHGGPFVGALERGNLLACQFHPELSGRDGLALVERWIARSLGTGGGRC